MFSSGYRHAYGSTNLKTVALCQCQASCVYSESETVFQANVIPPMLGPIFLSPPLHNVLPVHLSPGLTPAAQHLHINIHIGTTAGKAAKSPADTT